VGAAAKDHDALSPRGAFTLELWLKPKPGMAEARQAFLLDTAPNDAPGPWKVQVTELAPGKQGEAALTVE